VYNANPDPDAAFSVNADPELQLKNYFFFPSKIAVYILLHGPP
jgi:hypothetical protein